MGRFVDSGFILEDTLVVSSIGAGLILIKGSIRCLGGIRLDVEKVLKVVEGDGANAMVQTTTYNYNASISLGNVLRYDSPHNDHNEYHHVHRYDVFAGDQDGTTTEAIWPSLGDVITELQNWYCEHYLQLCELE